MQHQMRKHSTEKIPTFTNMILDGFLFGFFRFGHRYGISFLGWRTNLDSGVRMFRV
jgi:hypothetical protein